MLYYLNYELERGAMSIIAKKKEEMEMTMDKYLKDQLKNKLDTTALSQSETTSDIDCGKAICPELSGHS